MTVNTQDLRGNGLPANYLIQGNHTVEILWEDYDKRTLITLSQARELMLMLTAALSNPISDQPFREEQLPEWAQLTPGDYSARGLVKELYEREQANT